MSKNGLFEPFLHLKKTNILPRQARDKHREGSTQKSVFSPQVRFQLNAAVLSAKGTAPAEGERREPAELGLAVRILKSRFRG